MARIRSIHPALFTDEAFAGLSMAARVLLLGLWTEADDQGVFDWKPITLKMRIMPVDNVDVPELLTELQKASVIARFEQDGKDFGAIRNFCKFQRPKTPKYRPLKFAEIRNYVASTYPVTEATEADLTPFPQKVEIDPQMEDGGGRRGEGRKKESSSASRPSSVHFENLRRVYPKRKGNYGWAKAEKKFSSLVKTGVDPDVIVQAARRLAQTLHAKIGTEFIPMPASWLNSEDFVDVAVAAFDEAPALDWDMACRQWNSIKRWPRGHGNDPESPACRAPPEILRKHGIQPTGASHG